ncbi:hypothetical protein ACKWTF_015533 [Chironomus riparius]
MADEHDDLLNFEIGDGDFADGTLNEDELLLSDEENFDDHKETVKKHGAPAPQKVESKKDNNKEPIPISAKRSEKIQEDDLLDDDDLLEPAPKKQAVEMKPKTQEVKPQSNGSKPQVEQLNSSEPEAKNQVPEQKPQPSIAPVPKTQTLEPETQVREPSTPQKPEISEPKRKTSESDNHVQLPDPLEEPLDYEEQQSFTESDQQDELPEFSDSAEPSALPVDPQSNQQDDNQYQHPPHLQQPPHQQFPMGPRQFRPNKFGPRGMNPRWMNPSGPPAPVPFPSQQRQLRPPQMGPLRPGGPQQMRPGGPFPQRAPFYMQQRPGGPNRPPGPPNSRFFFQNQNQGSGSNSGPGYVPSPIAPNVPIMPRKVLINPNFKGGIEAVKTQLLKEHFSQSSSMSEDELLRKQQEFINSNMRSIEKRRHERSPSPNYRRSYSHSPSPPRNYRRRPFRPYERRRSMGDKDGNKAKEKDENLPEEDEETRAYRQKIETQRKQREELLRQKEMRRKLQMEAKVKETEPLKPIVVTEKKIILTKKPRLDEKSTTPPIDDAPLPATLTTQRKIVLRTSKEVKSGEAKIGIAGAEKKKLQKIIKAEN